MIPRLAIYGAVSTSLAGAVVVSALKSRPNFFAAAVSVGRSSGALIVLANFALFNAICFGIVFKNIFFGQLRTVEFEHLFEKLWIFLTESLLALTIFRDDFSPPFALMYGVLVFLKCFHWITADRVDYMDQIPPPGPPAVFHIRIILVIFLLTLFDLSLVLYSTESVLLDGVSAMVLFASEYTILVASISGTIARYIVNLYDLRRAGGREDAPSWEEKSMYMFYIDLGVDFAKLLTYLTFFLVILLNYGLPIHILRDVYMTLRSFISRCSDLMRYRRATRNMDALYPNASQAEMEALADRTCIICREEMAVNNLDQSAGGAAAGGGEGGGGGGGPNETPKKLACGHVFHFHCLRSWLERQQSCPTCRRDVLHPNPNRTTRDAPAPPTPGAVPVPPRANAAAQDAGADGAGAGGQDAPFRSLYDEYFRQPAPNGDAAPNIQINGQPTVPLRPPASQPNNLADFEVQRSIWGAPIIPGQFFSQPLGAAPRLHDSIRGAGAVGGSRLSGRNGDVSGSSTPITSRPPVVFRSIGSSGAGPSISTSSSSDLTGSSSSSTTTTTAAAAEVGEVMHGAESEADHRRIAAEAALRRMGLMPTSTSSSTSTSTSDSKGKAKEQVDSSSPFVRPHSQPYLTPINLPSPHPTTSTTSVSTSIPTSQQQKLQYSESISRLSTITFPIRPGTAEGTRAALDDRLNFLNEVDGVIHSLVGELTNVRKDWQIQDDTKGKEAEEMTSTEAKDVTFVE